MAQYDITLKSSALTVSSSGVGDSTIVKIDDTHYLDFWIDTADADIYAQVFEINSSTGAITAKGTKVSVVGSANISFLDCCKIDSTHYAVVYRGDGSDGFSRVIEVNTSTWAITLKGTAFEFETSDVYSPFVELFDSTHLIVFYGVSDYGYMRMLTINTSTWQLSGTATRSLLDTNGTVIGSRAVRLSGNKFFVIWKRDYDVRCQVVEVNTSTWGISLLSTQTILHIENTNNIGNISIGKVSDTKIVVLHSSYQADNETYLKTVEISSDKASSVNSQIITTSSMTDSSLSMVSDSIFVLFYRVYNDSVYTQAYQLNGDDTFTSVGTPSGTMAGRSNSSILLTENTLVNTWNDSTNTTKYTQLCEINLTTSPTVTTQAVSSITNVSAIGNGNITDTGGENATRRGFCYKAGSSGDPTTADSVVYDDGSFGTGAYTKAISGLTPNTEYRVRAYAINSAGTSYGTTVSLTTIGTNIQINIGDTWKTVESIQINIGDSWKEVTNAQINIGDSWKTIY